MVSPPDRTSLAELTARLVAIESVNPTLVEGGSGEAAIGRFVAGWLEQAGLEVTVQEAAPGRPNVVGVARGSGGGRSLLLNAHTDTVGAAEMERPYEPRLEGDRLHGRGALDMKGSLAAIMLVGAAARRRRLRGDVVVTAVADEEAESVGCQALIRGWRADAAIVAEPTDLQVGVAHRGFAWVEVVTLGRAAHGSRPDLGVDAIARMGRVLAGLEALDARLRAGPRHPLLGTGSAHASLIEGGQEMSTYPQRCGLRYERRTVPGEDEALVEREARVLLGDLEGTSQVTLLRHPFEVGTEEPIVALLRGHAGGTAPVGLPFWTDSAILAGAGVPTVLFGPGGAGAHASDEWVDLGQLERCAGVIRETALAFCA